MLEFVTSKLATDSNRPSQWTTVLVATETAAAQRLAGISTSLGAKVRLGAGIRTRHVLRGKQDAIYKCVMTRGRVRLIVQVEPAGLRDVCESVSPQGKRPRRRLPKHPKQPPRKPMQRGEHCIRGCLRTPSDGKAHSGSRFI